jgi:ADP-ribose pyrophosphatase YjhB (NUDIX family)
VNSKDAIDYLEKSIEKDTDMLPEELFLFVSRLTPLVCADLLIQDNRNRTLFTWRDDKIFGKGWHLPGGVIRHNERFSSRIVKVGQIELGAELEFDPDPCRFVEDLTVGKTNRGHFIAFLFRCRLLSDPDARQYIEGTPRTGDWAWFQGVPDPLIQVHEIYKPYF